MHKEFMAVALQQAWLGRGLCAPNPSVGAVLVHNQHIIAMDWHRGAGTAHAEQLVLRQLNEKLDNLTLYVTLEPCNHWGKTSPCVTAIIAAGVKQVVYAFKDPNPIVMANNTPHILQDNGIAVVHFPLPEIDLFYQSYKYWTQHKKPWVTAKIAQSLDGKIALKNFHPMQITNQLCHQFTHQQRQYTDIILTTAKTVNSDNPAFTARIGGEIIEKPIALLDSHGTVKKNSQLFDNLRKCYTFYSSVGACSSAKDMHYAVSLKDGLLDLDVILYQLGELGFHDVWVEAGGRLFTELHRQQLVQRTYIYIAPTVLGVEAISAYHHDIFHSNPHLVSWQPQDDNVIACLEWLEV